MEQKTSLMTELKRFTFMEIYLLRKEFIFLSASLEFMFNLLALFLPLK